MNKWKWIDYVLGTLLVIVMYTFIFQEKWPHLFYERFEYPAPLITKQIENLSFDGEKRLDWYNRGYDEIPYDKRIISGDDADVLTYQSLDMYDLYTFFQYDMWIRHILLHHLKFRLIQFQNTEGIIDTIYFAPEEE